MIDAWEYFITKKGVVIAAVSATEVHILWRTILLAFHPIIIYV
jgi:hypothetical protein